jgi:FAD/FMN-containing dehydrogenase
MKRREFLQVTLAATLARALMIPNAHGEPVAIESLRRALRSEDGIVLTPEDRLFTTYETAFNKRIMITPQVRVLCRNANAVTTALQWAQQNHVPLALRSGGHSYEGFSQSPGIVIDTRMMNDIVMSEDANTFACGAGAQLGMIYREIAKRDRVIPAGSCPTVGVTGHTTGGGYGLIARGLGLACDSLLNVEMVLANGQIVQVNERDYPDLFWATRGAGGGNYGIITRLEFRTHRVKNVISFSVAWDVTPDDATAIIQTWQQWAPECPQGINPLLKISKTVRGIIRLRCVGQSIGTESVLHAELKNLTRTRKPGRYNTEKMPFLGAVEHFGGRETDKVSVYMKAKSDYLKRVMTENEIRGFLNAIPSGIVAIFDSYGGQIRALKDTDTAFAHREGTISSVQYYTEWQDPSFTSAKLQTMRTFYAAVRPYFSGGAYSNYPDLDLENYLQAYWGQNLDRLIQIKNMYDPQNVFQHRQSIPLRRG